MERLLKWLDDLDDVLAMLRTHAASVLMTAVLLIVFAAVVGAVFVFGPLDLLASP